MTELDLSRLTDEEIRQEAEDIVEQIDAAPVENRIRALARALIAARAENKLLRQRAEALLRAWDGEERSYQMPLVVSSLRALLQSEKETEADADIAAGRVKSFDSMDELIADLDGSENKRKDDALRKALDTLIWASGAFQSEKESSAWSRFGLPVVNDLRALLQSEKGGAE